MRNLCGLICIAVLFCAASSGAEPWQVTIDANIGLNEAGYSDNWDGGESGSVNWTFLSTTIAEKQINEKVNTRNTLKLSFGQTHNQDRDTKDWTKPVKSTDLIDLESVFRFSLGKAVDPYASGRLESQFYDARDPDKSRYLNPITLTESAGVARMLIDEEKRKLLTRFGGGLREHISRDDLDPVSGKRETNTTTDGGLEFVSDLQTPLWAERILLTSKLTVFQALMYSESDDLKGLPEEDYWKAPDVNWEMIFSAGISEMVNVKLYMQLLYDKEIDRAGRFKETIALGFTYKLM